MDELVYAILGIVMLLISFAFLRNLINNPEFVKENYRNAHIPALGGLVVLLAIIFVGLVMNLWPQIDAEKRFTTSTLVIVLGFALIGLLDDLLGDKVRQGFKGHISELLKGRLTTGSLKLFGGPALVLLALSPRIISEGYLNVFIDVLCISLFANVFNLLDLSPGRCTKYGIVCLVPLLTFGEPQVVMYGVLGVLIASLVLDIRENYMLGDTGSNLIGALIGLGFVQVFNSSHTLIIVGIVFLLNIISEFISFSKIIQSVLPLRVFEELGQLKARKQWAKDKRAI